MAEQPLFSLGRTMVSPRVQEFGWGDAVMARLLARHASGDYGLLPDATRALNDLSIQGKGARVLSVYRVRGVLIWVITDNVNTDRAATSVMVAWGRVPS